MVEKKEEAKTVRMVSIILHFGSKLVSWQLAKRSAWTMCP